MEKRILLVSPFPPFTGGVSISSERLFNHLEKDGFYVQKYDIKFSNQRFNQLKFLKFLRFVYLPVYVAFNRRFDVIHFHISGSYLRLYISFFRIFFSNQTKFISTIHGDVNYLLEERFGKLCLQGFDKIICVKKGDSKILSNFFKGKIVEIPAFIRPVMKQGELLPLEIVDFFDSDSIKITINGALICDGICHDLYGFMDVLELINNLRSSGRNVKLFLINLGNKSGLKGKEYLLELKDYIRNNNLNNYVYWYEGEPLNFYLVLKKVDIFIRPTKTDGDAMSIREALLLKIPTIASNVIERPKGTIVYRKEDPKDLYNKCVDLIDNYKMYKDLLVNEQEDFYSEIKGEYHD